MSALKKRLLGGVLKAYVHDGDDLATQISFTSLMAGSVRFHNVNFIAERLQDLLASYMPLCLEIESCVAHEVDVSLNWKSLSSKPVTIRITEMTVHFKVHSAAMAQDEHASEKEKRFWKMQAGRVLGDLAALAEMCAAGALPPTLTDRVTQGLNVEIEKVTCRLSRPDAMVPEAFCEFHGVRYGAVSDKYEWTNDLEETRASVESAKEMQYFLRFDVQHISLYPISGESEIAVGPLSMKDIFKVPALLPSVAPFTCTSRVDLGLGTLRMSGPEEKLIIVLKILNDMSQSMQLLETLEELSQLGAGDSPILRFHTGNDLLGSDLAAVLDGDGDEEEEEVEIKAVVRSFMEQQENWWSSVEGRRLSERTPRRAAIDYMLQKKRKVSETVEAFFQLGVRSSLDETDPMVQTLSRNISIRSRSSDASGSPTIQVPKEALTRFAVQVDKFLVDAILPEGHLKLEVDDLNSISDSALPLTSEARSCCAKLFDLPLDTIDGEVMSGTMLSNLTIRALDVTFMAAGHTQSSSHEGENISACTEVGEDDECVRKCDDERIIVRLPKGLSPSLTMRTRGVGYPLCRGDIRLHPMELTVTGLNLRVGLGLDALTALSGRLGAALPQVSVAPSLVLPSSCYCLRLVDSIIVQQPPPQSVLCHGGWPMKVSVPLMEAKTLSSLFELPNFIHGALHPDWRIDEREWWRSVLCYNKEGDALHLSIDQASQVQSHLVRLEKEVDLLKQAQLESVRREDKLKDELKILRQREQIVKIIDDDDDVLEISAMGIY